MSFTSKQDNDLNFLGFPKKGIKKLVTYTEIVMKIKGGILYNLNIIG